MLLIENEDSCNNSPKNLVENFNINDSANQIEN